MSAPAPATTVAEVLHARIEELRRPGVLSVRTGFEVKDGWLTGRRAIVVTVERKLAVPPPGQELPDELDGIPVDVRQASPAKRQSLEDPAAYASTLPLSPDQGAVPHFPHELLLTGPGRPRTVASTPAAVLLAAKPNQPYVPPSGVSLQPVRGQATIRLSVSPDTGWAALRTFLSDVSQSLTVGIYDFTSRHVLDAVTAATTGRSLSLVIDHPAQNASADQTDEQTVAELRDVEGATLSQAWALTKLDPLATAWTFPYAYHVKVAAKDHRSTWLSSGNWNNSNQPDIDPVDVAADREAARGGDRDWHVVIDDAGISSTFEAYLLNDLRAAQEHQSPARPPGPPLQPPAPPSRRTPEYVTFFPQLTVSERMTITPVLTPDGGDYVGQVKQLIDSARARLYLQFQYIEPPPTVTVDSQPFQDLVLAVVGRQGAGVEIKIILSEWQTQGYLEQLATLGIDVVHNVKIQNNVHNKGIVADGQRVLVSSQNWSTAGTLQNRDAGVIIDNATAAGYYQQVFLHDWANLSTQRAAAD